MAELDFTSLSGSIEGGALTGTFEAQGALGGSLVVITTLMGGIAVPSALNGVILTPEAVSEPCDLTYVYEQASPATVWDIVHNLGKYPATTVVDTAGTVVFGEVLHIDANHLRVSFSAGFAGKAFLN